MPFPAPLGTQPKRGPSLKAVRGVSPGGEKGLQDHPPPEALEAEPVSSSIANKELSRNTHLCRTSVT